ncbi:class I SAM-dependent methyltransferase [Peptococcaceae bacterium 1198_IL3148]
MSKNKMVTNMLSSRLATLSNYVKPGSVMADIGTDHGYLPIYLVKSGICPKAIACDVRQMPLETARKNVLANCLDKKIELRLGDGIQVLKPGEVQVVSIAGMGGSTIRQILSDKPDVLAELDRLILQPMGDEESLRQWLLTNGWRIIDEELVLEDERLYTIIVSEQGAEPLPEPIVLEIGPRLMEKHHSLLPQLIARLQDKYRLMINGLAKSNRAETQAKLALAKKRLQDLEEVATKCQ